MKILIANLLLLLIGIAGFVSSKPFPILGYAEKMDIRLLFVLVLRSSLCAGKIDIDP